MPIDPSIPLQVQQLKLESPVNQLAMMGDAMKIGEMQRGIETQNKLRNLYSQGIDIGTPEGFKQVASIDPATALKLRTDALKNQELQGNIKKTGLEVTEKSLGVIRERSKDLLQNTSNENFIAHTQENVRDGLITPEQGQRAIQNYTAIPPNQRVAVINQNLAKAEEVYKMAETQRHNKVTEGIAGGHLALAKEARSDVGQTLTDSAGNVTLLDKQGNVMKQLGPVGKSSATYEKTAALQKQQGKDINLAITEIENAIKPGGTLEKATSSGAGKLRDAAGNFIGYATEGSIAAASLKPVGDLALKMVPRFEGPQSDKDTASYKEASGQLANDALPVATRKAAAQTVLRLMKARKGQFVNETMANEGIGASDVDTNNPLLK